MLGVGVDRDQAVGGPEEFIDGLRGRDADPDAFDLEVGVVERRVGEERPGGQGADQLGEVEGDLPEVELIRLLEPGHVTLVRPAGDVPLVIEREGIEAA